MSYTWVLNHLPTGMHIQLSKLFMRCNNPTMQRNAPLPRSNTILPRTTKGYSNVLNLVAPMDPLNYSLTKNACGLPRHRF